MGACARVHVRAREGCVRNTLQPPSPSPLPPSHSTAACLLFVVHLKPRQVAVGVAQALSLCAGRRPSVHVYRVRGWVGRGATVPGVLATPPPPPPPPPPPLTLAIHHRVMHHNVLFHHARVLCQLALQVRVHVPGQRGGMVAGWRGGRHAGARGAAAASRQTRAGALASRAPSGMQRSLWTHHVSMNSISTGQGSV